MCEMTRILTVKGALKRVHVALDELADALDEDGQEVSEALVRKLRQRLPVWIKQGYRETGDVFPDDDEEDD